MTILKQKRLEKLYGKERIFRALAIDQRGALKRMLGEEVTDEQLQIFKRLVSENLTTRASAILLDPEFGWQAAGLKEQHCGLIMAYEKTGYDKTKIGRFPDLIDGVSVNGLTTFNEGYHISSIMAKASSKVVCVADSTKFNRNGFNQVLPMSVVNLIITDSNITEKNKAELAGLNMPLQVV
ncbi:hypothetical protein FXB74_07835 [Aggregatibacter actinomycetemcomitans]|nr:hypothetical protein FXB74_07835 [Aggregatibacter actinomycetemcomitans]